MWHVCHGNRMTNGCSYIVLFFSEISVMMRSKIIKPLNFEGQSKDFNKIHSSILIELFFLSLR
jgi:hypothetical protein